MRLTRRRIVGGLILIPPSLAFAAPGASPRLGAVRAVTLSAPDLAYIEAAYTAYLGYVVAERGVVTPQTAQGWGARAVAGRNFLSLAPASGESTWLRFVEQAAPANFRALTTAGWNAAEIIVQDVDVVAARLEGSPFRVVVPAHPLDSVPEIHAMQVVGPAGEMLYLTAAMRPMPERDMPEAKSAVGRCFIAVLGGTDLEAMLEFYRGTFGNPPGNIHAARVRALSAANGLPLDRRYDLATVRLGQGSKIEIDRYPENTPSRPRAPDGLPYGMAMVTFECRDMDAVKHLMVAAPMPAEIGPYRGQRCATIRGAAGEWIELIETPALRAQ